MKIFILLLIIVFVLFFFNLINKNKKNISEKKTKNQNKIVDLERDPKTNEYKPKK